MAGAVLGVLWWRLAGGGAEEKDLFVLTLMMYFLAPYTAGACDVGAGQAPTHLGDKVLEEQLHLGWLTVGVQSQLELCGGAHKGWGKSGCKEEPS